jgi:hypothetical protein
MVTLISYETTRIWHYGHSEEQKKIEIFKDEETIEKIQIFEMLCKNYEKWTPLFIKELKDFFKKELIHHPTNRDTCDG